MDAQQFTDFMKAFKDSMKALAPAKDAAPKLFIRIPTYRGEPNENVDMWLRQVRNIFHAQGIKEEGTMIHYAATGFEDAALHWFVHKIKNTHTPAFADWKAFTKALKEGFQPLHYQQHLR